MTSTEYDEYIDEIKSMSDPELDLELDDAFIQMADEDEGIKYVMCVHEQTARERKAHYVVAGGIK